MVDVGNTGLAFQTGKAEVAPVRTEGWGFAEEIPGGQWGTVGDCALTMRSPEEVVGLKYYGRSVCLHVKAIKPLSHIIVE